MYALTNETLIFMMYNPDHAGNWVCLSGNHRVTQQTQHALLHMWSLVAIHMCLSINFFVKYCNNDARTCFLHTEHGVHGRCCRRSKGNCVARGVNQLELDSVIQLWNGGQCVTDTNTMVLEYNQLLVSKIKTVVICWIKLCYYK